MDGTPGIDIIIILGTAAMLFLAVVIVVFIIIYQRRMFAKQNQINQLKIETQQKLIKAEIDTKEREQLRISQELHDDIGASLSSMRFILNGIDMSIEGVPELADSLARTTQRVRQISNDLQPHVLFELGMAEALKNYIERLRLVSIKFTFTFDTEDQTKVLQNDEQLAVFRVMQELINNIMKHADAKNVWIDLKRTNNLMTIVIKDDGNGIIPEPDSKRSPDSLGLKNIQSRMEYVKGTIDRAPNSDKGSHVTLKIPL